VVLHQDRATTWVIGIGYPPREGGGEDYYDLEGIPCFDAQFVTPEPWETYMAVGAGKGGSRIAWR